MIRVEPSLQVNNMYDSYHYRSPGPSLFIPYRSYPRDYGVPFYRESRLPVNGFDFYRQEIPNSFFDNPLPIIFAGPQKPGYPAQPPVYPIIYSYPTPVPRPITGPKLIDSFKTKDGQLDVNKLITTAGQLIGTVNQLVGTVKNVSSLFKS